MAGKIVKCCKYSNLVFKLSFLLFFNQKKLDHIEPDKAERYLAESLLNENIHNQDDLVKSDGDDWIILDRSMDSVD